MNKEEETGQEANRDASFELYMEYTETLLAKSGPPVNSEVQMLVFDAIVSTIAEIDAQTPRDRTTHWFLDRLSGRIDYVYEQVNLATTHEESRALFERLAEMTKIYHRHYQREVADNADIET